MTRTIFRTGGVACFVLAAALVLCGCDGYYAPSQITVKSVLKRADTLMLLQFEPLQETLYYCSRVDIQEKGNKINIQFVRSPISRFGPQKPAPTAMGFYNPNNLPVFITDGPTSVEIWTPPTPATRPAK